MNATKPMRWETPLELVSVEDFLASFRSSEAHITDKKRKRDITPSTPDHGSRNSSKGEHSSLFNHACQARGRVPRFVYIEEENVRRVNPRVLYRVRITVDADGDESVGIVLATGPACESKKAAKEEACRLAKEQLERLDSEIGAVKGLAEPAVAESGEADGGEELLKENWIGFLQDFTQARKLPLPIYEQTSTHFSLGPFRCSVRLPESITLITFGDDERPFQQKGLAKKAAARQAVLWLRANGLVNDSSDARSETSSTPSSVSWAAPPSLVDGDSSSGNTTPARSPQSNELSIAERARYLALFLGMTPPAYEITQLGDGFCQMIARFSSADLLRFPDLAGDGIRVERAFGGRTARQECARLVVRVLEDLVVQQRGKEVAMAAQSHADGK